jgi:spermidine synthase
MIARLALPRLGGAPSVWNSAMLVYQTLLLAGYAYAHLLGRFSPRTQAGFHVTMLLLASLTLPIGLSASVPPPEANPFLWVPSLLLVSIGPLFFVISAHAPLLQRWFAVSDGSDPYPLYAASNLGSFGGLITYPLLVEPYTSIGQQRWLWSGAYAVLILLVASCAFGIRNVKVRISSHDCAGSRPSWRMIGGWVVLAAVPSGLILSTTLHITTDILAMPLLWVLPLGAYLLSFSIAFSEQSRAKDVIIRLSPLLLLFGSLALFRELSGFALLLCVLSIVNLFTLSVALHGRLFERRPPPEHLTLFYLAMSLGGVLGGVFCALVAPLTFDWTYEHLLLLTAAAWLICAPNPFSFMARLWVEDVRAKPIAMLALSLLGVLVLLGTNLFGIAHSQSAEHLGIMGVLLIAVLAIGNRILFTTAVAALLITAGAWEQLESSLTQGKMTRSFFGIYSIREGGHHSRLLAHGTTVHGMQNLGSPNRERMPTSYYAPASGVGLAMQAAPTLFGPNARIAVIGLGAGTLACYAKPEQQWTFYEIDPAVVEIARDPNRFTFLSRCKPDAQIEVGDARLLIEREATGSADLLVVDAFSSDAIPMHLLTREAFAEYGRLLSPNGLLLVHISNRYMDLEPVVSAAAASSHWAAVIRRYRPSAAAQARNEGPSDWVAMSRSTKSLQLLTQRSAAHWTVPITPQSFRPWTDDHASILPLIHWGGKTS